MIGFVGVWGSPFAWGCDVLYCYLIGVAGVVVARIGLCVTSDDSW